MVSLDIFLPDMPGWRILDRLKADLSTRHIPICIVSTDDSRDRALYVGRDRLHLEARRVDATSSIARSRQLTDYVARPRKKVVLRWPPGRSWRQVRERLAQEDIDVFVIDRTPSEMCELLRTDAARLPRQSNLARRICSPAD